MPSVNPWELKPDEPLPWQAPSRNAAPWELKPDEPLPWQTTQSEPGPPSALQRFKDYLSSSYASLPTPQKVIDFAAEIVGRPATEAAQAYKQFTDYAQQGLQQIEQPGFHNTVAGIGKGVLGELGAVPAAIGTFAAATLGALGRAGEHAGFGIGPEAAPPVVMPPVNRLLPKSPELRAIEGPKPAEPRQLELPFAPPEPPASPPKQPPPQLPPGPPEPPQLSPPSGAEPGETPQLPTLSGSKPPQLPPEPPKPPEPPYGEPPGPPPPEPPKLPPGGPEQPKPPPPEGPIPESPNVSRYELRDIQHVLNTLQGGDEARVVETNNWLRQNIEHSTGETGLGEKFYRYRERQTDTPLSPTDKFELAPEEKAVYETQVLPWEKRNEDLYKYLVKKRNKGVVADEILSNLNPAYVHRQTFDEVQRQLGLKEYEGDIPYYGFRVREPSSMQERRFFRIRSDKGATGIVYLKDGKLWLVRPSADGYNSYRIYTPKTDDIGPGYTFSRAGKKFRIEQAYTDEIEQATGIKYHKNLFASVASNYLQLGRYAEAINGMENITKYLSEKGLASNEKRSGFIKTKYPGLEHLYMHPRIAKALDTQIPKPFDQEDPIHWLSRVSQFAQSALFWNPVVHAGNVAAHLYERGFKWFSPAAYPQFALALKDAWKHTIKQDEVYQQNLGASLRLLYGPRKAHRELLENMYGDLKQFETPEGKELLSRFEKLTNIPPGPLIKAIYQHAGDALWFAGDVLTLAASLEKQKYGKISPEAAARAVHKDLPSYRIPMEELLPGQPGRLLGSALRHPATKAVLSFAPYHENVMRGLGLMAEDIGRYVYQSMKRSPEAAKNRDDAIEALGKAVAIAAAMAAYQQAPEFKRYGPFSILQAAVDWLSGKHLSQGSKVRVLTGGMYSPSPIAEGAFNLLTGMHAYSLSNIQMTPEKRLYFGMQEVPMSDRLQAAIGSLLPPVAQAQRLIKEPTTLNMMELLGVGQHPRLMPGEKTQENIDLAKQRSQYRKAHPEEFRSRRKANTRSKPLGSP